MEAKGGGMPRIPRIEGLAIERRQREGRLRTDQSEKLVTGEVFWGAWTGVELLEA